jgi:hypothetical protein
VCDHDIAQCSLHFEVCDLAEFHNVSSYVQALNMLLLQKRAY